MLYAIKCVLLGIGIFIIVLLLALVWAFFRFRDWQWRKMYESTTTLHGKTVIVTGGNAGIGKQAAIDVARRGARVIIGCRNPQKAEAAVNEIKHITGNSDVFYRNLDLASMASVRAFATQFKREFGKLDILLNNAGIGLGRSGETTPEGHDIVFGTNHFGHFLLTLLLIDLLRASYQSRVINISSKAHILVGKFDMTPMKDEKGRTVYPQLNGYAWSKLANILFTRELARRLEGTRVTTYSISPGGVFTSIWESGANTRSYTKVLYKLLGPLLRLVTMTEEVGAQTSIYCAVEESITRYSGGHFSNCGQKEVSNLARDDGLAKKLWEISCDATGVSLA